MSAYRTSYAAAATLTYLLAAGCADTLALEAAPAYIGKVESAGQDAAVGVVSDGSKVTLYLCGGPLTYATTTRWFQGELASGGTFTLAASGGFTGSGDLRSGTGRIVTGAGQTLDWSVRPTKSEEEGLYAAMDGSCRTGAVVGDLDGDGSVRLQGTWCDGLGRFAQVSPLAPSAMLTARGIEVEVLADPAQSFFVDRVLQP
jgi:hypothetical protein